MTSATGSPTKRTRSRRQQRPVGLRRGAAVGAREADAAGDGRNIGQVGGGIDGDHTGQPASGGGVDMFDTGMGVGRAQKDRHRHAGRSGIGCVVALAGQQPEVFAPPDGFCLHRCQQSVLPLVLHPSIAGSAGSAIPAGENNRNQPSVLGELKRAGCGYRDQYRRRSDRTPPPCRRDGPRSRPRRCRDPWFPERTARR